MHHFFNSNKFKIAIALCIALLAGIFTAAVADSGSSPISSLLSTVMTPLETVASKISASLSDFRGLFVSSGKYREQISSLESEAESYQEQMVDYEKLKQKLEAYEAFLDVKEKNPDYTFVPATIILRDTSDTFKSFTLNKGSDDGVKVNDPVIYGNHLVGAVKEITSGSCVVYTIFNPSVSISAYEIRTREDCFIEASSDLSRRGLVKLSGLSRSTPVVSGGVVCTSGIGGIYPRDLIIGSIEEVFDEETDISAYALVKPDTDISALIDVFIITGFDGKSE